MRNLADHLRQHGYARISALSPSEPTLSIAERVGFVSVIPGVARVQELVPRAASQAPASGYGGMYGLDLFPLHTDMAHWYVPPRYFLLRCICPAPQVETLIVHFRDVIGGETDVTLRRAIFRPRRRLDGRLTSLRLKEGEMCRWDPAFIVPVTTEAERLRERIVVTISAATLVAVSLRGAADCLLVDNWAVMHGRANVPANAMSRRIERVYLETIIA